MGLDLTLQAVPADWDGLERAATESDFGAWLQSLPGCVKSIVHGTKWLPWPLHDDEREFLNSARVLAEHDPTIWTRVLRLHRRYDAMHFLLAPVRRGGSALGGDPGSVAIRGEEYLGEHARGGQGVRIRWTTPGGVRAVDHFLSTNATADFLDNYDWGRMKATAVYKLGPPESEPVHREVLAESLDQLRNFYSSTAEVGYGVIHVID